ncbi:hypothetical protein [Streptomyces sp. 6-11-2]|uniref:hypothetical protein n=1 Tax=Streptomyces sp. 6-11-2 TaxID=2585753 RepID=UPI001170426F|nr:hypothetical protein TNCT6_75150 [Streptomyces sp. 6-11-2]
MLPQDWGSALGYEAAALWGARVAGLNHSTVRWGHFMAEEAPDVIAKSLRDLPAR